MTTDVNACDPEILSSLDYLVLAFRNRHGGDLEELRSEANYYYVLACNRFDGRGELAGWIKYRVWHDLLNAHIQRMRKARLFPKASQEIPLDKLQGRDPNRWQRFLAELSDDARTIAQLLVGEHIDCLLPKRMRKGDAKPGTKMDAVVKFLKEIGWTGKEILKSIKEIGDALS